MLLSVEHLVKDFPVTRGAVLQRRVGSVSAVADVNFAIRAGQTIGLVGESGCGKTTIGRLVVGLDKPTSGSVNFEGKDLAKSSGREYRRERQHIQLMFQDAYASLDPRMRAGAVLLEPLAVQRIGSRASGISGWRRCWTTSGCRAPRPSGTRTSSPAASASGSASPARSCSTRS